MLADHRSQASRRLRAFPVSFTPQHRVAPQHLVAPINNWRWQQLALATIGAGNNWRWQQLAPAPNLALALLRHEC
jgi:hypothetical protein